MKTILVNEWRQLRADKVGLIAASLLLAFLVFGLFNGRLQQDRRAATVQQVLEEERERLGKLQTSLQMIESGALEPKGFLDPRGGAAIGNTTGVRYMVMPPAPLGSLAVGLGDLHPHFYKLGLRSKSFTLSNDELENPLNLLSGTFDLSFGIVLLFPLFVIAMNYNLLSSEREQGTLPLILSQPVSLRDLLAGKLLVRGGVVLSVALLVTLLGGLALGDSGDALPRLLGWCVVITLYGLFWLALCVAVNAWGRSSATNAIALAGCWLAFCIIVPSAVNITATALYPIPSRVEMIQSIRRAGKEAQEKGSQLLARYLEDHPELSPTAGTQGPQPDFSSITYAVQMEVDKRTEPVLKRFDRAVEQQQSVVDNARFLSPAILTQVALGELSGTGLARYRHFQAQATAFHQRWLDYFFPLIFQRAKLTSSQLGSIPTFRYKEEKLGDVVGRTAPLVVALAVISAVTGWIALRLLARFQY